MILFVAGMSRAGSMWTYNVARALFEAAGWSVLPPEYPQDESEIVRNAFFSEVREKEVYCIKTHHLLKNSLPTSHEVKVICNIRDVRDACLSYMRFMHADYDAGKGAMISMMNATDHYLSTFSNNILSIRFEDLTRTPVNVMENISTFLKINISESKKGEILRKFDKTNIQDKLRDMSKLEIDENVEVKNQELRSRFDVLKNLDGTNRIIDKTTGFQSGHITSITDGEWKTYFDRNQADQLTSLSRDWLIKHGYKV